MTGPKVVAGLALVAAALAALLVPGEARPTRLGHDAGFTYGYLPSVLAHGDLDFTDDAVPFDSVMPHTAEGRTHNAFPVGPALWWSVPFVAGHGTGALVRAVSGDGDPAADGRSWPYDVFVGLGALLVGLVGVAATWAAARRLASPVGAVIGTAAVWLAGPALAYTHLNTMASHTAGFASAALLLLAWLWLRQRPRPVASSGLWPVAGLGLLAGLVVLSRWQNAVLLLGPAIDAASGRLRGRDRPDPAGLAALAGAAAIAFLPQLVVWDVLYGSPFRPPRGEAAGAFLDLSRLHVVDVLFSWRHGMLSWHPVLAVGVVGLALTARRHPLVAWSLLGSLAAAVVVNAGVLDWWAGASFGARRFDGLWPALAVGVAVVADRVPRWLAAGGVAVLAAVNWFLLNAFHEGLVTRIGAVTPADLIDVAGRVPLAPAIDDWSGAKVVWVLGLAAAAPVVLRAAVVGRRRRRHRRPRFVAAPVLAGMAAAVFVAGGLAAAGEAEAGPFDPHVFEAGYFVPQPTPPPRTDRTVAPGEDVWTLIWAFPGFLPPGEYTATVRAARSPSGQPAHLAVRIEGEVVVQGDVTGSTTVLRGAPFRLEEGFLRLDLVVTGAPVHLDAVRIQPT